MSISRHSSRWITMNTKHPIITIQTIQRKRPSIPSIKDDPQLPDVQGQPSIDVSEMTRNPEAEVVDSKIEYDTKEADTDAE